MTSQIRRSEKNRYYALAFILTILFLTACKKSETTPSIVGYWTGTGVDNALVSDYISFLYNSNGTARAYGSSPDSNTALKANATYSIDADSIRTTVVFGVAVTQFSSKLNSPGTQMTGTFRRTTGNYYGTYSVTRQ